MPAPGRDKHFNYRLADRFRLFFKLREVSIGKCHPLYYTRSNTEITLQGFKLQDLGRRVVCVERWDMGTGPRLLAVLRGAHERVEHLPSDCHHRVCL